MMKLSETARKEFEAAMERRYGITRDVLYAEGVENRMRLAAEKLEERGLDVEELFMDDTFFHQLFHDRDDVDSSAFIDETIEIAGKLGYDI
ncbi:MAG: hypothetical protein IRZ03_19225 [Acidobacterium ailaaui]|nr:hypothetical protein [Pseudacidobacterium ailaaui]